MRSVYIAISIFVCYCLTLTITIAQTVVLPGYVVSQFAQTNSAIPSAMTFDPIQRKLYFVDMSLQGGGALYSIGPDRVLVRISQNIMPPNSLFSYLGGDLEFASNEFIYTISNQGELIKVNPNTGSSEVLIRLSGVGQEAGLSVSSGKLYFTDGDGNANALKSYDLRTGTITTIASNIVQNAASLEYNPVKNALYFMGYTVPGDKLYKADIYTENLTTIGSMDVGNSNFVIDPNGEYAYIRLDDSIERINLTTGEQTLFMTGLESDLPNAIVPEGKSQDIRFGLSSNGLGFSMYVANGSTILEVSGADFRQPITNSFSSEPLCHNAEITVPVIVGFAALPTNRFQVELSDEFGRFDNNPTVIGETPAGQTIVGAGTIRARIPTTLRRGENYRIRVTSSMPATKGWVNPEPLKIGFGPDFTLATQIPNCAGTNQTSRIVARLITSTDVTYRWSTGSLDSVITVTASGSYTVTVANAAGCSEVKSVNVRIPTRIVFLQSDSIGNVTCKGANNAFIKLRANGGTRPYRFFMNGNSITGNVVSGLAPGRYTFKVQDSLGCNADTSFDFIVTEPEVALSLSQPQIQPANCSPIGSITPVVIGGEPPYRYQWSVSGQSGASIINLPSGRYSLTVTDSRNCSITAVYTVEDLGTPPVIILDSLFNETCVGTNNGRIYLTIRANTPNYNLIWSNQASSEDLINLSPGVYTLTVTDATNCLTTASYQINPAQPFLTPQVQVRNVTCFGQTNGRAEVTLLSNATHPHTYRWSDLAQPIVSTVPYARENMAAGTYFLTVANQNGCAHTISIIITQPERPLTSSLTVQQEFSCAPSGSNARLLAVASGGTEPYNFILTRNGQTEPISIENNVSFQVSASGLYCLSVSDGNNCGSSTACVTLSPPSNLQIDLSVRHITCIGQNNGQVTARISNGTPPYTVIWSNGSSSTILQNLSVGQYAITVTDALGCRDSALINITQPNDPLRLQLVQATAPTCPGRLNGRLEVAGIGGTAPYAYTWADNSFSNHRSNLASGNYTVTLTDSRFCTTTGTFVVPSADSLRLSFIKRNVTCPNLKNGRLTVQTGLRNQTATYLWSNGSTQQTINNLAPGTYTVTVASNLGCVETATTTITQPETNLSIQSTQVTAIGCANSRTGQIVIKATGATPPYRYIWLHGAVGDSLTNLRAGTYTVTVTDSTGFCTLTRSFVITQPASELTLRALDSTMSTCFGAKLAGARVQASGGTGMISYRWSNDSIGAALRQVVAGVYTVTATDENGCALTRSFTLTEPPQMLLTVRQLRPVTCKGGSNGALTLTIFGGIIDYRFIWSNGSTNQILANVKAGQYTVTATDAVGCSVTASGVITQPDSLLTIQGFTQRNITCFGSQDGFAEVTASGGTGTYAYRWNNQRMTPAIDGLLPGSYVVTVTDENGCSITRGFVITQPQSNLLARRGLRQQVGCRGDSTGILSPSVSGGTPPYQYRWSTGQSTLSLRRLPEGIFTLTVTDANGCITQYSDTIPQPSRLLLVTADSVILPVCRNTQTGYIRLRLSGGELPFHYVWNVSTLSGPELLNLYSGIYTVTVIDAANCRKSLTITLEDPDPLSVTVPNLRQLTCVGDTVGNIIPVVEGGTLPYTYLWSNGSTDSALINVPGRFTPYNLTVTDANGCFTTISVLFTPPRDSLEILLAASNHVRCFGEQNGSLLVVAAGGLGPYTYTWSSSSTSPRATQLTGGVYTVTVTDARPCALSRSFTILEPDSALQLNPFVQHILCRGEKTGAIRLNLTGGTRPYAYLWSDNARTGDRQELQAFTYTVTVTDAFGCTVTFSTTITQPNSRMIVRNFGAVNVTCPGGNNGALGFTITGGNLPLSAIWSNGSTQLSPTNLMAGVYTGTITDANGCVEILTDRVTEPSPFTVIPKGSSRPVSCAGLSDGVLEMEVRGGSLPYTYLWSTGDATVRVEQLQGGTYTLTVTDGKGCTFSAANTVHEPTELTLVFTNPQEITCGGTATGGVTASVSGGTPPYFFAWSNGSIDSTLRNVRARTYTVTVTDSRLCSVVEAITLIQPEILSVQIQFSNPTCNGSNDGSIEAFNPSGGTSPYTFRWSNQATDLSISNLFAGTYNLSMTDAVGCTRRVASVTLTQPEPLDVQVTEIRNVSCNGLSDGRIVLRAIGGVGPYAYNWNDIFFEQNQINVPAGTYNLTVTDLNACTTSIALIVEQPDQLTITSPLQTNILCKGESTGAIQLNVEGGAEPYRYLWSDGSTSQNRINLTAGTYTLTLTDNNFCVTAFTVTLTEPDTRFFVAVTDSSSSRCFGASNGFIRTNAGGGVTPYVFVWSSGDVTPSIFGLPPNIYTLTATDAVGCSRVLTFNMKEPPRMVINLQVTAPVRCFGDATAAVLATVTGGVQPYAFLWNNNATSATLSNLRAGSYTLTVTDANACTQRATVVVTTPSGLTLNLTAAREASCNGRVNSLVGGGTPPYAYRWNTGFTGQHLLDVAAGSYTLTVTDANGCTVIRSRQVTQPASLFAVFIDSVRNVSCGNGRDGSIFTRVTGGTPSYRYLWSHGSGSPAPNNLAAGTYTVTVRDLFGCLVVASATITAPSPLRITTTTQRDPGCNGFNSGFISVTASGGATPYTYSWSNGGVLPDLSDLVAGNYTLTVTDAKGCTQSQAYTLTQPSVLLITGMFSEPTFCTGGRDGKLRPVVEGGVPPYTFLWSDGQTSSTATALSAGLYQLTVADAKGCQAVASGIVTQPANRPIPELAVQTNPPTCFGGTNGGLNVSVVNNQPGLSYTYSLDGVNYQAGAVFTNLPIGQYSVYAKSSNGCVGSKQVNLTNPTAPRIINVSNVTTSRATVDWITGDARVSLRYNLQFRILGSSTWISLNNLTGTSRTITGLLQNTLYEIRIQGRCPSGNLSDWSSPLQFLTVPETNVSCSQPSSFFIEPVPGVTDRVTVHFATTSLDAGYVLQYRQLNTLTWTTINCIRPNQVPYLLTGLTGDTDYQFRLQKHCTSCPALQNGQSTFTPILNYRTTLNCPSLFTINNNTAFINTCSTTTLKFDGARIPTYQYQWFRATTPFATTPEVNVSTPGRYSLLVKAGNCVAIRSNVVEVRVSSGLVVQAQGRGGSCLNPDGGDAQAIATAGVPPYAFVWSTNPPKTGSFITGLRTGVFTVTATDAFGCTTSASTLLSAPATFGITLTTIYPTCASEANGTIIATVNGGVPPYNFLWSNNASASTITDLTANTYTLSVADARGCINIAQATLTAPAGFTIRMLEKSNIPCFGSPVGRIHLTAIGGQRPLTFQWSNGAADSVITGLRGGLYTVTVADRNGCVKSDTFRIHEPTSLEIGSPMTTPEGCGDLKGTATIDAVGGTKPYRFVWSTVPVQTTQIATNLTAGVYTVTLTDSLNCIRTAVATITKLQSTLDITVQSRRIPSCPGFGDGQITVNLLGGVPPYRLTWRTATSTIPGVATGLTGAQFTLPNVAADTHIVTIRDAIGCELTRRIVLASPPSFSLEVTSENPTCADTPTGAASVTAIGGDAPYTYRWSNGALTRTTTGLLAGRHEVTVTDTRGCATSTFFTLTQPDPINIIATHIEGSCRNAGNTGIIRTTVQGGVKPYLVLWSNGGVDTVISRLSAGIYTVTVIDALNCQFITGFEVPVVGTGLPIQVVAQQTPPTCGGLSNGVITVSVIDVGVPRTFVYSLDGITYQSSAVFTGLSGGNYTVYAKELGGCIGTVNVSIPMPSSASITVVNGLTVSSATVNWSAVTSAQSYRLEYRVVNAPTWTTINNLTGTSRNLTTLQHGTNYEVRIYTICAEGISSAPSSPFQFSTLSSTAACKPPTNVFVSLQSNGVATLNWTPVDGAICYNLSYGIAGTSVSTWPVIAVSGDFNSFNLPALLPNTNYQVRIRSNCSGCSATGGTFSVYSQLISFSTATNQTRLLQHPTESATLAFSVYPNPTQGMFFIKTNLDLDMNTAIILTNTLGQVVFSDLTRLSSTTPYPISTEPLAKGVYYLKLVTGTDVVTQKLVIE